jgi:hypothetical protein
MPIPEADNGQGDVLNILAVVVELYSITLNPDIVFQSSCTPDYYIPHAKGFPQFRWQ